MGEPTAGLIARKPRIEVVRATDAHAEALAEFYRAVWDRNATPASVRDARARAAAANPVEPGSHPPEFICLADDTIVGFIGTIPTRFLMRGEEHSALWLRGFMVLPEWRNSIIGYLVLKEAARQTGLVAALVVASPARRLFQAMGFTDLGPIGNHVTILRPGIVLGSIDIEALGLEGLPSWMPRLARAGQRAGLAAAAGAMAAPALALWRWMRGAISGRLSIRAGIGDVAPAELDALWRLVRPGLAAASVRDGAYLRWRYAEARDGAYEMVAVREEGRLVGVAVVRRPREEGDPRLRGIKVATLSDILFPVDRPDVGLAALAGAERAALASGGDALLCTTSHPALAALLPRRAYVPIPGNVHFLIRDPRRAAASDTSLDGWWLTRGDAGADEVF